MHRNVANLVVHTDLNCLSALQYAVDVLARRAHRSSAATTAAAACSRRCDSERHGLIDNWLRHVQDVRTSTAALIALDGRGATAPTGSAS